MINNLLSKIFKTKSKKKRKNTTDKLIEECNKILISNEHQCQCYDINNHPSNDIIGCQLKNNNNSCKDYNTCKQLYSSYMTGYEPRYNPDNWSDPLIEKSHNCYAYFLDDKIPKVENKCLQMCRKKGHSLKKCKNNKKVVSLCSDLKPQPGNYANNSNNINFKSNRIYSCNKMEEKIFADNYDKKTKKSKIFKIPFNKKCPKKHYKGGLTVQNGKTYHFYRQDNNGRFSHKQGTLRVENVDASKKPIYAPHLADKNYNKKNTKDGISYDEWCGYYCIPDNNFKDTHAAGGIKI